MLLGLRVIAAVDRWTGDRLRPPTQAWIATEIRIETEGKRCNFEANDTVQAACADCLTAMLGVVYQQRVTKLVSADHSRVKINTETPAGNRTAQIGHHCDDQTPTALHARQRRAPHTATPTLLLGGFQDGGVAPHYPSGPVHVALPIAEMEGTVIATGEVQDLLRGETLEGMIHIVRARLESSETLQGRRCAHETVRRLR